MDQGFPLGMGGYRGLFLLQKNNGHLYWVQNTGDTFLVEGGYWRSPFDAEGQERYLSCAGAHED